MCRWRVRRRRHNRETTSYECRTQNDEGQDITDRMQLAVQVGRTVVKSMPRSAYKEMDMDKEKDIMAEHQEAYMHMPTVWTYETRAEGKRACTMPRKKE